MLFCYLIQVGQSLSDPIEVAFPSLEEAFAAKWASLKDRWGPPPKPFVVAQSEMPLKGGGLASI